MLQWEIIKTCSQQKTLLQKLSLTNHMYLITDTEIYSMEQFEQLNCPASNSRLLRLLAKLFTALSEHITVHCQVSEQTYD